MTESCCRAERTESSEEWEGWIELWSSLRETALQSTAKPAEPRVCYVLILLLSSTPPHKCVTCVSERGRKREREIQRESEGEGWRLPSCPPELLQSKRALEMLLYVLISPFHSFMFPRSFPSLPHCPPIHTHTHLPGPPPLLSSPSYIIGYVCVSCRSFKALRAVCNHWKGVSCKYAQGGVHRWQHHPPCSARPSSLSRHPSTTHFSSSLLPFTLCIHAGRGKHHHLKCPSVMAA